MGIHNVDSNRLLRVMTVSHQCVLTNLVNTVITALNYFVIYHILFHRYFPFEYSNYRG